MIEVFLDQQSFGIKKRLEKAGIMVHDDSEIRGTNDTSVGIPDDTILKYLSEHRELQLVTKDRRLAVQAATQGLRFTFIDESEVVSNEAIRRLVLDSAEVRRRFDTALTRFLRNDSILLALDANERSITHKFAEYLQDEFKEWNVDCEYNRDQARPKELDLPKDGVNWDDVEGRTVFPDIIVHLRTATNNLLAIEVKKSTSKANDTLDRAKLTQFKNSPFFYQTCVFLKFYTGSDKARSPQADWV